MPKLHVISMIVATCDTMRAAGRLRRPGPGRAAMRVSDWSTGRHKGADGSRMTGFADAVTAGTSIRLSNQRALACSNEYIGIVPRRHRQRRRAQRHLPPGSDLHEAVGWRPEE